MQIFSSRDRTSVGSNLNSCILNDLWEALLIKHETCWARVVSDSMSPAIRRGDQVLVEKTSSDKVRFGDIIVFKRNGTLTTHRVIGKYEFGGECYFREKGDAGLQSSLVPARDIIGRVVVVRNPSKSLTVISGSGRLLQLNLACISYTSLQLWRLLKYCLTLGGHTSHKHGYGAAYNGLFSWLRRNALRFFQ